jgi:uncharacterized membrane protein YbhN (UPF0104 family)
VSGGARRAITLALRFAVAALGLVLAFRVALSSSDAGLVATLVDAWRAPASVALAWFALAWLLLGVSLAVGAIRFRGLLRGAGLDVAMPLLLRAYLVATFFNLVLPGAMLGDVYRFWDARRDTGEGARVLGVVVLERLLSLAALGAVALAVAPAVPGVEGRQRLLIALVLAGGVFVLGALAVLLPPVNRLLLSLAGRFTSVSPRLADGLARSLHAVAGLASQPAVIARAFAWSLVNQGLPIAALVVLAVPLDALVPWYWFAVIVPFVTLVSLLPVSVGGTGVRELLYVSLFGAVGMRPEAALALSLSVLAAALLWGLVGLVIFALGRRGATGAAGTPARPAES